MLLFYVTCQLVPFIVIYIYIYIYSKLQEFFDAERTGRSLASHI